MHKYFLFNQRLCLLSVLLISILLTGCPEQKNNPAVQANSANSNSTTLLESTSSTSQALQIITKSGSTGSFDAPSIPSSGGVSVRASRIYNLDGSLIPTGNLPTWYSEARVFLTSTRTSAGLPSYIGSSTGCAYFDVYNTDNNPDSNGYYTIDGYNATATGVNSDIDQCAGTNASELNQLSLYIKLDRRFMESSDNIQLIVKAKAIDNPNTAPTTSSCVVGGFFDATACSNQVFAVTMRSLPGASAKPFYILFPSAKALDLLSEAILLPINIDTSITTISIDRVKGGAIFYGLSIIKL